MSMFQIEVKGNYIYFEQDQNLQKMIQFNHNHSSAMEEQMTPKAMDKSSPSSDLLIPSSNYQCQVCKIPLGNYTRIVAREKELNNEGFSNYCIACFAGWSKLPTDQGLQKEYQYFVVPSPALKESEGSNWTILELCALFQCVQKFGVDSWGSVHQQFTQKTGAERLEIELSQKYFEMYENTKEQFNYQRSPNFNILYDKPKQKSLNIAFNIDKLSNEDHIYAWQFYEMLKSTNILEISNFPTDNYSDYMLKVLLGNKQLSKVYNPNQEIKNISPESKEIIAYAKKLMNSSHQQQRQTYEVHKSLCKVYINMRKRESRNRRELIPPTKDMAKTEENLIDHPELKKLKDLPDLAEIIEEISKLKLKRESLKSNLRAKKNHQRQQQNQAKKLNAKEGRAARNLQRQRKRLAQSLSHDDIQGSSPRRLTRSYQNP